MKIYTKTGDKGTTALIGGIRVPKYHLRIETYGTIDELNSHIGLLRDLMPSQNPQTSVLMDIQDRLFTIGSALASVETSKMKIPQLNQADTLWLETNIDDMDSILPPLTAFVLPGGHTTVSQCHIARCICRRAERLAVQLAEQETNVSPIVIQYLNRLSDYLFTLARLLAQELNAQEIKWIPKL